MQKPPLTALLAALLVAGAGPALAASPGALYTSAAYGYSDLPYYNETYFTAGTLDRTLANGTFHASADFGTATLTASMNVSSVNFGPYGNNSTYASATVIYDFAIVVGGGEFYGALPEPVPFTIVGYANLQAGGAATAGGSINVKRSPLDVGLVSPGALSARTASLGCTATGGTCGMQALSISGLITPYYTGYPGYGEIARITLSADARVTAGFGVSTGPSFASALVDPTITIASSYLAAHPGLTFTVMTDPSIGAAPVPEPAPATLLAAGLLGLGWLQRQRRTR